MLSKLKLAMLVTSILVLASSTANADLYELSGGVGTVTVTNPTPGAFTMVITVADGFHLASSGNLYDFAFNLGGTSPLPQVTYTSLPDFLSLSPTTVVSNQQPNVQNPVSAAGGTAGMFPYGLILINPDQLVMTVSLNTPFTPAGPAVQLTPNVLGNSLTLAYTGANPQQVFFATAGTPVSVPGPIVGAGIPGLVSALGGLYLTWRRKRKQTT
jgi:hypothetical protein